LKQYFVEGRVIPERVDFNLPRMDGGVRLVTGEQVDFQIYVWKSKLFVHVQAPESVEVPSLRNALFGVVGNIVNYAGFYEVLGISYELDSITDLSSKETTVFGVEGYVFEGQNNIDSSFTFFADAYHKGLPVSSNLLTNKFFSRATFELRNAIRYPDFTALHCRLAIEAIRNYFDEEEVKAWVLLRDALKVQRSTLDEFKDAANNQRHGRNQPQTWAERQRSMQIAWEVTYRFTRLINNDPTLANALML
jgi:hypothetical protein